MKKIAANPIRTRKDWEDARARALADPGRFHGEIAKREIFWFDQKSESWVKRVDGETRPWIGFHAKTGAPTAVDLSADHDPWSRSFNNDEPPFYRWFEGGLTNACFNEVDVHVMAGFGEEIAFIFEGDRWDPALEGGRGGPVVSRKVTRKQLLWEVAKCAQVLKDLGLKKGDCIALNMPNILEQIFFIEAAKRLGIIYTPVFGGFSAKTLSDRIHDAGAKIIITTDGAYRNAQVVGFKEVYTDKALDDYIPALHALEVLRTAVASLEEVNAEAAQSITLAAEKAVKGEITVERSDVMRGVGHALEKLTGWSATLKSKVRTVIAEALVRPTPRVQATVVVQHAQISDLSWNPSRDQWAHDLLAKASEKLLAAAQVSSEEEILALPTEKFIGAIFSAVPPEVVDAEFPLFIIYTSGSTGKPKGVVHTHGGYVAGIAHTMRVCFDVDAAKSPSTIYVIADPGWITGQSYLISAALTTRTTSVVTEGSPLFPSAGRFSSVIERYKVNIFKAGSTFLKAIGSDPENVADVKKYDCSSLRAATFCAEPTSPSIQQFAMDLITPWYMNSYWATEHGGIVLTHFYGNEDFKLQADAHTFPLPWIFAEVWTPEQSFEVDGKQTRFEHRQAALEEKGEIVITQPYPYLARTVWGDAANVGSPKWKGDIERYAQIYFNRWSKKGSEGKEPIWAYTQGDYACTYKDGGLSLHGRSDDVINTSGHRIGTEEIEGAILKDKQINPKSAVGNAIVVGAPHKEKGTVPVAFILTAKGRKLTLDEERRLSGLVREEKGAVAAPAGYICVSQFPETRSGKYMRRFLKNMLEGEPLGDTTTLRNPECLSEIERSIRQWQSKMQLEDDQQILQIQSTLRVEYHEVKPGARLAVLTIDKPPVNALDERALDELNTVIEHLGRRQDIHAIVLTGAGTKSFVAGADIRQFLEEMHEPSDVLPLSNKAMQAMKRLENMTKPVIAAINGLALGGGNEFQMAAHYRIAEPTAKFGQPEINLHLIPGYGGTQRLPRLLEAALGDDGLIEAAGLIIGGRTIDPEHALEIGLIHEISTKTDALTRATSLARQFIIDGSGPVTIAMRNRLKLNAQWEKPRNFPASFDTHPEIKRLLNQARLAGRELPVSWAIDAIKTGYKKGFSQGLEHEARLFAEAVVNPKAGKHGIRAFFDKKSAALPTRRLFDFGKARLDEKKLIASGEILAVGAPFYPGVTPVPQYQYANVAERNTVTGLATHGDPKDAEVKRIIPVPRPRANEALVFMLTSEINYNDIWAITGVPVSTFDNHDEDWHVTGSGGLGLVASIGAELKDEGRIKVGDLVAVFSGQSQLLSPVAGLDPMFAEQKIQGYETPDGSHQQFMIAQGPQLFHKLADLTLEAAGSYMLNLGTIYRALFTTLKVEPGKNMFVEGAATGTGLEAVKAGSKNKVRVTGMVSSADRAQTVLEHGGVGSINRRDPKLERIFSKVPEDSSLWGLWEEEGHALLESFKSQNNGKLAHYSISHAGETSFPRSFQLLEENGILTFYGASNGYHFTFMGKPGQVKPETILTRASCRAGQSLLIFYGTDRGPALDPMGLECIEAAREYGARIVVCAWTDTQREFVKSMGFGDAVRGVFSIEELKRREGDSFALPATMPELPNPKTETAAFKEAVRWYQEFVFKPFASQVGALLRTPDNPRGYPDIIMERASQDTLCLSSMLVKPYTGSVVYCEDMGARRYSFYAPQVWMRQRRIFMPTSNIWGTHLNNAYEIQVTNDLVNAGLLNVTEPAVVEFDEIRDAHQEMWENRHRAANCVLNHALPQLGLKSKDELYQAWSMQETLRRRENEKSTDQRRQPPVTHDSPAAP